MDRRSVKVAKDIRQGLKEKFGYNRNYVRVRCDSTAINVTAIDYKVNCTEVEKYVNKFRSVDYDEVNGEILEGGNLFVFFENDAMNPNYLNRCEEIIKNISFIDSDKRFQIDKDLNLYILLEFNNFNKIIKHQYCIKRKYGNSPISDIYTAEQIAYHLTRLK